MLDKAEQRVIDDVANFGWHLVMVSEDEKGPGFVYSIGMMQTLGHPEVIIFGLSLNSMATIINDIGNQIREGRSFLEEGLYEDVLQRFACKISHVDPRWYKDYFGFGLWYQHHIDQPGTLKAVQCLWPDKQGLFPDEAGFNSEIVSLQPVLK